MRGNGAGTGKHLVGLFFACLSLLVSIVAAVLWARSYRTDFGECVTFKSPGGRYLLNSRRGRLALLSPPPRASADGEARAKEGLAALDNDLVRWAERRRYAGATPVRQFEPAVEIGGTGVEDVYALRRPDIAKGLLDALEDPRRFWAAHVLLVHLGPPAGVRRDMKVVERAGAADVTWFGVSTTVRLKGAGPEPGDARGTALDIWTVTVPYRGAKEVRVDPSQQATALEFWSQRLNTQTVAASYAWPLFLGLIFPTLHARSVLRRAERRRKGWCEACGYDLRASADRCPECGAHAPRMRLRVTRPRRPVPALVRPILAIVAALSLVFAAGFAALWWRSYRRPAGDRLHVRAGDVRSVVVSRAGWVEWLRPPEPVDAAGTPKLWQSAAAMRNHDLGGEMFPSLRLPPAAPTSAATASRADGSLTELYEANLRDAIRPLLWAMDDPDRFAAAHVMLSLHDGLRPTIRRSAVSTATVTYNGLQLDVSRGRVPETDRSQPFAYFPSEVAVDPFQLAVVRDFWDDKLCTPVASAPYWFLVVAMMVPPSLCLGLYRSNKRSSVAAVSTPDSRVP